MTRYQLILLDLGGVVVDVESDRLVLQIAQLLGQTFEDVQAAVYHEELLLPFELGRIRAPAYYDGLKARLRLPWSYEEFVRAWNGIFTENREVTALLKRLRSRHRLVALSNTNELHLGHIKATIPAAALFEDWVASCDVGLRKPDPRIYELALGRFGVEPSRAVYVDDRPELVEAGRAIGLAAIRFESSEQLERDLRALGLSLDGGRDG
jgi:epoxide hydrolase-like predicted phosphatase